MANTLAFITYIKRKLVAQTWFAEKGFSSQAIYRQYLPQVKEPVYPCITLSYEVDKREVFAGIDELHLFISIHAKDFDTPEVMAALISTLFHTDTCADDQIVLFKCHDVGIPTTPSFNKDLNCWEAIVEFSCSLG